MITRPHHWLSALQRSLFFFMLMAVFSAGAFAQTPAHNQNADGYVSVRILPETTQIKAGEEIWIGIEQSIASGWHTYWKNPGDSGAAPTLKWSLPEGFEISDIHWPAPEKLPYGPLLNYGYSDHVMLLQKLKAPQTLPDSPLNIAVNTEILVCKDICIPEFSSHELSLNALDSGVATNKQYLKKFIQNIDIKTYKDAFYTSDNKTFTMRINLPGDHTLNTESLGTLAFFPEEWGLVMNNAKAQAQLENNVLTISQEADNRPLSDIEVVRGVITFRDQDGQKNAFAVHATTESAFMMGASDTITGLAQALVFALLGGLILNLMPCVFPVLSIKALSLIKISEKHPERARMHGIAYTGGIILSFLIVAGLLITLKAAGFGIGWGFQLQNPVIVTLLAYILFTVGLNLAGYFEFSSRFANIGSALTQKESTRSSFFTGILATIVATPCTAPFMSVAIGFALLQPAAINLAIFATLGLGLALPYLVLSFAPNLQSLLPKPGTWMVRFKELLAFPLFASAIWLVWVLAQQTGAIAVLAAMAGMLAITFAFWVSKHTPAKGMLHIFGRIALIGSLVALGSTLTFMTAPQKEGAETHTVSSSTSYSPETLENLLSNSDDPIFVEMTAAWCITCKVNNALAISVESTQELFEKHNVHHIVGDWTNYDSNITKYLNRYGRDGVPLYVYYGPTDPQTQERPAAVLLPQLLTPRTVRNYIE